LSYSTDADTYRARGYLYDRHGKHENALSDYSKAIEFDPTDVVSLNARGYIYMMIIKDKKKACSDWKRACELGSG